MTGIRKVGLRVFCLVLCLICLMCLLRTVVAADVAQTPTKTVTAVVRNQPSNDGFPIGQMVNGTKLNILEEKKTHYKIDCYDMTGYILKSQVEMRNGEYYVNCQEEDGSADSIVYTDYNTVLSLRKSILDMSEDLLGGRYVYGGNRPGGFDCSGFSSYVMNKHGFGIHRTASTQLRDGVIIPTEALQVGDLVFFRERGSKHPATHVGIYVGDNTMIHSARHGVVRESLDSHYYKENYLCARRVLHPDPAQNPQMPVQRSVTAGLSVSSITGRTAQCCR